MTNEKSEEEPKVIPGQLVLSIDNTHYECCGTPTPIIPAKDDTVVYTGYYENIYGEQAVFTWRLNAAAGELRMGDAGWENVYDVVPLAVGDRVVGIVVGRSPQSEEGIQWMQRVAKGVTKLPKHDRELAEAILKIRGDKGTLLINVEEQAWLDLCTTAAVHLLRITVAAKVGQ